MRARKPEAEFVESPFVAAEEACAGANSWVSAP